MVGVGIRMSNIGEYLNVYVIDVVNETMGTMEMPNTLKDMKRIIGTQCIQVETIAIGDNQFKIIYTPKATDKMYVSCADVMGNSIFRGNIIVVGFETDVNKGETLCSLSDTEVQQLMANTGLMYMECKDGSTYNAYVLCNVKIVEEE